MLLWVLRMLFRITAPHHTRPLARKYCRADYAPGRAPAQNARSTASFRKVPPCTTMCSPRSSAEAARITLYNRILYHADGQARRNILHAVAPSFCACLTDEFINTVQREPRSTGRSANKPSFGKVQQSNTPARWRRSAKKSRSQKNRPHSRKYYRSRRLRILKHFISCPPMSIIKSTSGRKCFGRRKMSDGFHQPVIDTEMHF